MMKSLRYRKAQVGSVITIGKGELGGKGSHTWGVAHTLQGVDIAKIPKTTILASDVIRDMAPDIYELSQVVKHVKLDGDFIAVRSSGFSEDGAHSCAGVFDTLFIRNNGDIHALASAIQRVARSGNSLHATTYLASNGLEGGMAVMLQSVIGNKIEGGYVGPVFSGVVDTSSVNGDNTFTMSMVLGLGTVAVEKCSPNIIVVQKGHLARKDMPAIKIQQEFGEVLSTETMDKERIGIKRLAELLGFPSLNHAVETFLKRFTNPLYTLSLILERHFNSSPVDIEFAIRGSKLFLLQVRRSHMDRIANNAYPENVKEESVLAVSRNVVGAVTVNTPLLASYGSAASYKRDAENGFKDLLALDAQGVPYILIVPPEATSSGSDETLPITLLKNMAFVTEKLTNEQVHQPTVTGVDHFSRLAHESKLGYMEAYVNHERLKANSTQEKIGELTLFKGNFTAAACSATKRGVLFINQE
ncbi:MAG: PEP/pyruvate-binding domain-containing protein [Candidatus Micrarchaeota archaeon]